MVNGKKIKSQEQVFDLKNRIDINQYFNLGTLYNSSGLILKSGIWENGIF